MNVILRIRMKRSQRKIYLAFNISKVYDSVDREKLFAILQGKIKNERD